MKTNQTKTKTINNKNKKTLFKMTLICSSLIIVCNIYSARVHAQNALPNPVSIQQATQPNMTAPTNKVAPIVTRVIASKPTPTPPPSTTTTTTTTTGGINIDSQSLLVPVPIAPPQQTTETTTVISTSPSLMSNPVLSQAPSFINNNSDPSAGLNNADEINNIVMPLLKQYAKKNAQIQLRKLDKDFEKIDEDPKKVASGNLSNTTGRDSPIQVSNPQQEAMQLQLKMMQEKVSTQEKEATIIRVYGIYGFNNNLYAKVSSGKQMGYIVKKGDYLPDGRIVKEINASYISVHNNEGPKNKHEKIFVTDRIDNQTSSNGTSVFTPGQSQSVMPPMSLPQSVATPIPSQNSSNLNNVFRVPPN